jgi:hypothetical protein
MICLYTKLPKHLWMLAMMVTAKTTTSGSWQKGHCMIELYSVKVEDSLPTQILYTCLDY